MHVFAYIRGREDASASWHASCYLTVSTPGHRVLPQSDGLHFVVIRTSSPPLHQKLITKFVIGSILGAPVKYPLSTTVALARQSEATELVTAMGPHMHMIKWSLTRTASITCAEVVVVNEACSYDLVLIRRFSR